MKATFRTISLSIAAASLFVAIVLNGAPAHAQTVQQIKDRGKLVVGTLVDFPPFGILDRQGKPDGYDSDLARLIAKHMGVTLEIVPVSGPNRIPYLLTNKVDMLVAALGITPERAKQVSFSDPSATVDQVLYARKESKINGIEDLLKFKVGVARASAQDITLTRISPQGTVIQRFEDDPSTLQALLSKQVDAIAMSTLMIKEIAKVTSVEPYDIKFRVQRLVHGIAMRRGQDDLLNWVNEFLITVKKNGELNAIHQKWLGIDFVNVEKPPT